MATINYFDRLPDELLVKIFKDASRYSEDNDDDDDKRQEEEYTNEYFDEHVWCERSYTYTVLNILCWTCKRFNNVINYSLLNDDEFGLDVGRLSARPINSILPSPFKKFDWRKFAQHHYERNASDYPTVYYRANASEEHENSIWNYTRSHYSPVQRREGFYEDEEWEGEPGYILPLFYTRSRKRCDLDGLKVKPPHWCHYTNEPYCECRYERKRLAQCKLKYRYLEFTEIDLTRNCFPKFIQDKLTNLEFVTKLMIWDCNLDLAALKNILIWLPRVEKLSISRWSTYHSDARPYGWILNEDSPTRTLDYLHILPGNQNERCMIDPVVINVPAKIIDANVYPSEENLNLIRRYLVRYKTIIEHFRITLSPFNDSLCWHEFFEGFNVNSVLNEFEELEITTLHLNVDKLFKFSLEWHHEVQYDDSDK